MYVFVNGVEFEATAHVPSSADHNDPEGWALCAICQLIDGVEQAMNGHG